jgi:phytoene dehydrogenase-like protein
LPRTASPLRVYNCMTDADVAIVGAGLTGLRAALEVSRAGLSVLVIEKDSSVGGRLKTTHENGATLDHGFQVLLTGYPEFSTLPDLSPLGCRSFWSGARMRLDSEFVDLFDPLRHPSTILKSLYSPISSVGDLLKLFLFVQSSNNRGAQERGESTAEALERIGFSELFKGAFLKPFLRGVLLDPLLLSDSGLAAFYLRTFSRGAAALPQKGIQAFPELLASTLGRQHLLLDATVANIAAGRVVLQNGDDIRARKVICAVDALSAAAIGGPEQTVPHVGTATVYFLADRPPYTEPLIMLNSDESGPINNLAVVSNVQPSYAPEGKALISASMIGDYARMPESILMPKIRSQLHLWFGAQTADWQHVRSFSIANALPARARLQNGWQEKNGVLYAGDYLSYGSQNGALAAGRNVAQHILEWAQH